MRMRAGTLLLLLGVALSACSSVSSEEGATVRLGYFPNMTHATAIVGVEEGMLEEALGPDVTLTAQAFNAGPDVIEAIFNGALDASYIGPNPAINGFIRSNGEAIRIIAGATSGGAALVVRDGIASADDLAGTTLATPQLGNTQDVALRAWLAEAGLETDLEGGGDVSIAPQANGQALEAFVAGEIDGAWVPEPWATRMVNEGGGTVLVDEAELWPGGAFVTTHLIVATEFLEEHPDLVKRLLIGHVEANAFVNDSPGEAQAVVGAALAELTGSELPEGTLAEAWENLDFTIDPIAASLVESANDQLEMGLIDSPDLDGIYDLTLLNEVLRAAGEPEVPLP
jgi:NitT/TauT family transport system substrate-binding protein